ncbi:hypothetical protein [Bradyrhizobium brasilense]|uniref:hypothetical protein n=1 Tax=Bradyrhizobium brasilense TaxID=1419277 RepID=UPI001F1EF6AF|nr:hypothetical protein [Bradyrhizobium brasilense]
MQQEQKQPATVDATGYEESWPIMALEPGVGMKLYAEVGPITGWAACRDLARDQITPNVFKLKRGHRPSISAKQDGGFQGRGKHDCAHPKTDSDLVARFGSGQRNDLPNDRTIKVALHCSVGVF